MGCGICAKLNRKETDLVKVYKGYFTKYGKEYFVFRTSIRGDLKIVVKEQFDTVFESEIKPNFKNGAEFFHIKEYTG